MSNLENDEEHPDISKVSAICNDLLRYKELDNIPNQPHLYQSEDTIKEYFSHLQQTFAGVDVEDDNQLEPHIEGAIKILVYLRLGICNTRKYDQEFVRNAWFSVPKTIEKDYPEQDVDRSAEYIYAAATKITTEILHEVQATSRSTLQTMFYEPSPSPISRTMASVSIASTTVVSPSSKGSLSSTSNISLQDAPVILPSEAQACCCRIF